MSYKLPEKSFPKSDLPLTASFLLPDTMDFPDQADFPNRKRLRKFLRRRGYSIKQFVVKDNVKNTDLVITIHGYKSDAK